VENFPFQNNKDVVVFLLSFVEYFPNQPVRHNGARNYSFFFFTGRGTRHFTPCCPSFFSLTIFFPLNYASIGRSEVPSLFFVSGSVGVVFYLIPFPRRLPNYKCKELGSTGCFPLLRSENQALDQSSLFPFFSVNFLRLMARLRKIGRVRVPWPALHWVSCCIASLPFPPKDRERLRDPLFDPVTQWREKHCCSSVSIIYSLLGQMYEQWMLPPPSHDEGNASSVFPYSLLPIPFFVCFERS